MPKVGKKKFPYSKAGVAKAKNYAKKTGKKMKKKIRKSLVLRIQCLKRCSKSIRGCDYD